MASNAATSVPAEAEQFSRKGAVQEIATSDRLWKRERQSLSQATQLASKLRTTQVWSMQTQCWCVPRDVGC